MTTLLANQSNLQVTHGTLPRYVVIDDPKAANAEVEGVISILYAGATLSDRQCLEEPVRTEVPVTGTHVPEPEPEPVVKKPKKQNKWMTSIAERMSRMFGSPTDDSDILE